MNAPTLLVGLGGTGSKIVEKVAALTSASERNNIAFAVFDTDINELRDIQARSPFIKTIQTSTKQTVGEYLNIDTHARDTWFPINAIVNNKPLTDGAGQVRSISRLALDTVIRSGRMEPLHQAIQSLYKLEEDKVEQAPRVIIVSSLAGGTGSGLILPVGLYIKNYLATVLRQTANIVRGFFILPEVFYEVIKGQNERNNLKANAYAALRELDAFLMKGDGTLPDKYKDSVRMAFPRAASSGYEEYDVAPYDFCFLFDAKDTSRLNSFDQYLDHAANCIYAQSIGPMNKRSNSSEDNTIRRLARERGRNRYAGAGASMLIYPFDDIKRLLALKWAKQCVSSYWLKYDKEYQRICKKNAKEMEQGLPVKNPDQHEHYVSKIEEGAKAKDPFSVRITNSTALFAPDGITKVSDTWDVYLGALIKKIDDDVSRSNMQIKSLETTAVNSVRELKGNWKVYGHAYESLKRYYAESRVYVESAAPALAYSLFNDTIDAVREQDNNDDYRLERYMKAADNSFLHPNAMRYLLIRVAKGMKNALQKFEATKNSGGRDPLEILEKAIFPEDDEKGRGTSSKSFDSRKNPLDTGKRNNEQEEVVSKFNSFMKNVKNMNQTYVKCYVLKRGIEYIEGVLAAFDSFYAAFESKVDNLDARMEEIYKKYSSKKGKTVKYVCTSKVCLDKLCEKRTYGGNAIIVDSELSQKLYYDILAYSLKEDKPKSNKFFGDIFDKSILGYYEDEVMKRCGIDLDIDVISALEMEAEYERGCEEDTDTDKMVDLYIRKAINDTRALAIPFIETPLGEQKDPIHACAINSDLRPDKNDDSPRADLIRSELMNFGGVADEDIPKNMIMFYQSFYGLRANDLSKFAPPEKSLTSDRMQGEYYRAYFELIEGIHPEPTQSREISPHIDRWWHIVTKMPDLDEKSQEAQEYRIYAAFFWGAVCRYIEMYDDGARKKVYKAKKDELALESDTLIVSNGTECDKLYEVLDAIAIYPELVTKILGKVESRTVYDVNRSGVLNDSLLMRKLKEFAISEPCLGKEQKKATSIFDIPMVMKKSTVPDEYYEEDVINLLKVELAEVKRYFGRFCSEKELPGIFKEFVLDQFGKYISDIAVEKEVKPSIYREQLFERTCSIIAGALEEAGLIDEATFVRDKRDELKMS